MSIFDNLYPEETDNDDDIMPPNVASAADHVLGKAGHLLSDNAKKLLTMRDAKQMREAFTTEEIKQIMVEIIDVGPQVLEGANAERFRLMAEGMKPTDENDAVIEELDLAIAAALEKVGPIRVYKSLQDAMEMFEDFFESQGLEEVIRL